MFSSLSSWLTDSPKEKEKEDGVEERQESTEQGEDSESSEQWKQSLGGM